jgi:Penicillin-insensitive murein endopeptidase
LRRDRFCYPDTGRFADQENAQRVAADQLDVDPKVWNQKYAEILRTASQDPAVVRILVNAAIKKALCREAGSDRTWLFKVRPWYGHAEHFHVQVACPEDSPDCKPATPPRPSDGCDRELDFWFRESTLIETEATADAGGAASCMQTDRQSAVIVHVRFGSKADMCSAIGHVRFTPKRGHVRCTHPCLLWARSRHRSAAYLFPLLHSFHAQHDGPRTQYDCDEKRDVRNTHQIHTPIRALN